LRHGIQAVPRKRRSEKKHRGQWVKNRSRTVLRFVCLATGSRERDGCRHNEGPRITGTENQKTAGTAILIRCTTREEPCLSLRRSHHDRH